MAIEAKADFLRQLEAELAASIPAAQLSVVLATASDVLEGYDMRTAFGNSFAEHDDLLESYISAMNVQGRSQKTIDRYRYEIQRMMEYVGVPTRRITVHHLRGYLAAEKKRGIADSTLEGMREIYSAYFNWLQRESLIEKNPTANLGTIKREKKIKKIFSSVDIYNLDQACDNKRDRAILHFLESTGCRISEMTSLNRADVNLASRQCVVHGKGNKERVVYMSKVACSQLEQYFSERKDDSEALFIGRTGERFQADGVRVMLNKLGRRAKVDHVHPHKFRRTLATNLARHGMPIQEIASILGHDKIDTTMQYVVLDKDNTESSYRRYTA